MLNYTFVNRLCLNTCVSRNTISVPHRVTSKHRRWLFHVRTACRGPDSTDQQTTNTGTESWEDRRFLSFHSKRLKNPGTPKAHLLELVSKKNQILVIFLLFVLTRTSHLRPSIYSKTRLFNVISSILKELLLWSNQNFKS